MGHMQGYPAEDVIPVDSIIYSVNGVPVDNDLLFKNATSDLKPGEEVVLNTSSGIYTLELAANEDQPGKGFIGVYLLENLEVTGSASAFLSVTLMSFLLNALSWIAFFNINIALVNLLPVIPFDGGRMFKEIVETLKISDESVNRIMYVIVGFALVLLLVNVIPLLKIIASYFANLV